MPQYDVLFIHPPANLDFRRRPVFSGALGATVEQVQFTKVPIGLLSLAGYLDRHGYRVKVENLGDRMVNSREFDPEAHLRKAEAGVYAVGLHFQQHAPGAIEVARLCKQLHPGSFVVLGGLTATRFHDEIIRKYDFVDAVIRGEAEKAFLEFVRDLEKYGKIKPTPNLTFRSESAGQTVQDPLRAPGHETQNRPDTLDSNAKPESSGITITPLMPVTSSLDEFEFTRFDLLEPATSIFAPGILPRWSLEVCRGCAYNCSICGGSAYTYRTYLGRERPAFRSPGKIVEDLRSLSAQGIRIAGLYQDPRMGGERYWRELLETLKRERPDIDRLSLDLLAPAGEEFIREVAAIGKPVTLHICPDTGCEAVRRSLGRFYSNEEMLETVRLCHKYLIPVTSFFSTGLAGETRENAPETWEMMEKLFSMEQILQTRSLSMGLGPGIPLGGPITGPIVLDPGSPAFDAPEKFGYKLLYSNLEEYIGGLSGPSWHQWINYETALLRKEEIIDLIIRSTAFSIDAREEYGFCDHSQAGAERLKLRADIMALNEVDRIMGLRDREAQERELKALKSKVDAFLGGGAGNCRVSS